MFWFLCFVKHAALFRRNGKVCFLWSKRQVTSSKRWNHFPLKFLYESLVPNAPLVLSPMSFVYTKSTAYKLRWKNLISLSVQQTVTVLF
jgi:hypothetical protein